MTLVEPRSVAESAIGGHALAGEGERLSAAAFVVLAMLGGYIVLKPYYLLPSGLPQVADLLLAASVPFALLLPRLRDTEDLSRFKLYMMVFCFYAALVNIGWTFALMYP